MVNRASASLGAVLALLGFSLVTAANTHRAERVTDEPRRAELIAVIESRQRQVDDLDLTVAELRAELLAAQTRASRLSSRDRQAAEATARLAQQAGTVALRGPGLVVELRDSEREPPSPEEAGAYRVHDADLQLVANALFAAGAEAVAVNDSRLVATSPIRSAGDTIVVNFRPLAPPYRLTAIGVDPERFEGSAIARRFKRWTRLFGLGFTVTSREDVRVPAYTGRVGIVTATPIIPERGGSLGGRA